MYTGNKTAHFGDSKQIQCYNSHTKTHYHKQGDDNKM